MAQPAANGGLVRQGCANRQRAHPSRVRRGRIGPEGNYPEIPDSSSGRCPASAARRGTLQSGRGDFRGVSGEIPAWRAIPPMGYPAPERLSGAGLRPESATSRIPTGKAGRTASGHCAVLPADPQQGFIQRRIPGHSGYPGEVQPGPGRAGRLRPPAPSSRGHPCGGASKIGYDEAMGQILRWREQEGLGSLFGNEKDASFKSSLDTIYQTFDGQALYPSI